MICVSHGNQGTFIWRFQEEAFIKGNLKLSVKFVVSHMVYGCMTALDPGRLVIVSSKVNCEV